MNNTIVRVQTTSDRRITERLILEDTRKDDKWGDTEVLALDITTYHYKERRALVTSVKRVALSPNVVKWAMELRNEDPCPVNDYIQLPIARYSDKALQERHTLMLQALEENLPALIEWAGRNKHRDAD